MEDYVPTSMDSSVCVGAVTLADSAKFVSHAALLNLTSLLINDEVSSYSVITGLANQKATFPNN